MKLCRGLYNYSAHHAGCVATIGNFDGVHLAHQHMLRELVGYAKRHNLPSLVILFEPHPAEFFNPQTPPARLTRFREKLAALAACNIDTLLILRFTQAFAEMSANDFIETILIKKLRIHTLFLGDDFRFGYQRQGDIALLQQYHAAFKLSCISARDLNGVRISSTHIRSLLARGDLIAGGQFLGRPYTMLGKVSNGIQRGRLINFPTANIQIKRKVSPLLGVYAVTMSGVAATAIQGIANVGSRPTVDGTRIILEVHLFDFNQDIYGYQVQVNFLYKLRDEQRFDSFEQLKAQIELDAEAAKLFFAHYV